MAKVTPITEHFQHFVKDLQESFWGDLQGQVRQSAQKFFELLSERQRDLYMVSPRYARPEQRKDYRNGYYTRDFVTRFGTLRLRIARTRKKGFLPAVIKKFQRRAEEVALLIREAFLRGMSTRQVGRQVKADAQAIYQAETANRPRPAERRFCRRWQRNYPSLVRQLEQDLPELLSFFALPRSLWKKLRTTNIIERCFVEVRRRTRPMVCFVNVQSVDRIIYSIFQRFNLEWKNRTLKLFTQAA